MRIKLPAVIILILCLVGIASAAVDNATTIALLHLDNATDSGTYFRNEANLTETWVANNGTVTALNSSRFGQSGLFINGIPNRRIYTATEIPQANYGTGNFTEEAWVNITECPTAGSISVHMNNTGGPLSSNYTTLHIYSSCNVRFVLHENGVVSKFSLVGGAYQVPLNEWNHVALIRDADTWSLYLNGTLQATSTYTGSMPMNNGGIQIGGNTFSAAYILPGRADEIRFSNATIWYNNFTPPDYAYGNLIQSNFSASKLTPQIGESITFSQNLTGNTSIYNWSFGDGAYSEDASPLHAYSTQGLKTVNFTASNYALTSTNTSTRSNYINVTNATGYNEQNIWMEGLWINTIIITDASTGMVIPSVTVTTSNGLSNTTTTGTAYITEPSGVYVFYYTASGYDSKAVSTIVDSDQTLYVQLTATSTRNVVDTTWYVPKTVQFHVVDSGGNSIHGANVTARFNSSTTLPKGVTDLLNFYGMKEEAASDAVNGTLIMTGYSDSGGDIVFTMLSTLHYDVFVNYGGTENYYDVFPQDAYYQLRFIVAAGTTPTDLYTCVYLNGHTYTAIAEPDPYNITLMYSYQDTCGLTTALDYYVMDVDAGTIPYHYTLTPVTSGIYINNYTVANTRGKNYIWYENTTRSV